MHLRSYFLFFLGLFCTALQAQHHSDIPVLAGESWWGGATALGTSMPFPSLSPFDLSCQNDNNQVSGMLISNRGRTI